MSRSKRAEERGGALEIHELLMDDDHVTKRRLRCLSWAFYFLLPGLARGVPMSLGSPRSLTPSTRSSLARRAGEGTAQEVEVVGERRSATESRTARKRQEREEER